MYQDNIFSSYYKHHKYIIFMLGFTSKEKISIWYKKIKYFPSYNVQMMNYLINPLADTSRTKCYCQKLSSGHFQLTH